MQSKVMSRHVKAADRRRAAGRQQFFGPNQQQVPKIEKPIVPKKEQEDKPVPK